MESRWTGDTEDAFFDSNLINRNRVLQQPEHERISHLIKNSYYILAVDVGRVNCDTVVCVIRVTPLPQGPSIKSVVNFYTLSNEHFGDQAMLIKQLYYKYGAKRIVLDGNGLKLAHLKFSELLENLRNKTISS